MRRVDQLQSQDKLRLIDLCIGRMFLHPGGYNTCFRRAEVDDLPLPQNQKGQVLQMEILIVSGMIYIISRSPVRNPHSREENSHVSYQLLNSESCIDQPCLIKSRPGAGEIDDDSLVLAKE